MSGKRVIDQSQMMKIMRPVKRILDVDNWIQQKKETLVTFRVSDLKCGKLLDRQENNRD